MFKSFMFTYKAPSHQRSSKKCCGLWLICLMIPLDQLVACMISHQKLLWICQMNK